MKALYLSLLLVLAACTSSSGASGLGEKTITKATWAAYQDYLVRIKSTGNGAFAVTESGYGSYAIICPDVACVHRSQYKSFALQHCKSLTGQDCYVFAYGSTILVNYRIWE